jgi:hypothetical protein
MGEELSSERPSAFERKLMGPTAQKGRCQQFSREAKQTLTPKIPVEHVRYVPIDDIAEIVVDELEKVRTGRPFVLRDDRQWYGDLKQFVVDLIGPVPFGMGRHVWRIYTANTQEDKDMCRQLIRCARDAVAKRYRCKGSLSETIPNE